MKIEDRDHEFMPRPFSSLGQRKRKNDSSLACYSLLLSIRALLLPDSATSCWAFFMGRATHGLPIVRKVWIGAIGD